MALSERSVATARPRRVDSDPWETRPERRLQDAVLATVAYADTFDFPLKWTEIHRDLIGVETRLRETSRALYALLRQGRLVTAAPYIVLPGREGLSMLRRRRQERAGRLWPDARRFAQILGYFPFVRMVAVTGSLAADNPDEQADLDYLIVTAPGRLWTVRATAVVLVRLARRAGRQLCPNYLLTTRALALERHDLFTAHELLQAAPITGPAVYRQMLESNTWAAEWLPNRYALALAQPAAPSVVPALRRLGEGAMSGPIGDRLEAWEAGRKSARLRRANDTARFTADVCEGHFGHSRQRALQEFPLRCRRFGVKLPVPQGDERVRHEPGALRSVVLPTV